MLPPLDLSEFTNEQWTDELTQLPMRSVWAHYVELSLVEGEAFQVVVINIDEFQEVNDAVGRVGGDRVLQKLARRCVELAGDALHVCRLGGDEFICWGQFQANQWSDLLKIFSLPVIEENQSFVCTVSVGIANAPLDGTTVDQLIDRASLASKNAKSSGKNTWRFFSPEQEWETQSRTRIISNLKRALFCNEGLSVLYQPQWDLVSHELKGAEVLMRWSHPELGAVSPAVFIELAERGHLINGLSEWVLKQVDLQDLKWQEQGLVLPKYSVNISGKEISNDWYFENLVRALINLNIDLKRITLEITETSLLSDLKDAKEKCQLLKGLGVSLALDDFGVGYSSLGYVKELPLDVVKIDRLLLMGATHGGVAGAIFESSIELFEQLGLQVVVEGVETSEQWHFLLSKNIRVVQGYAVARPLSGEAFLKFFESL